MMIFRRAIVDTSIAVLLIIYTLSFSAAASAAPPCGTPKGGPCPPDSVTAQIVANSQTLINEPVSFNGSNSTGEGLLDYTWSHDGPEGSVNIADSSASTTVITFTISGDYTITLLVVDGQGDSDTANHSMVASIATQSDCVTQGENETYVGYEQCPATTYVSKLEGTGVAGKYQPKADGGAPWTERFVENFEDPNDTNDPVNYADRSGSIAYKRWSTRFPYGDWKNNSAAGDEGWFVNTTGLEPGLVWEGNIYPDMELFIEQLELSNKAIYSRTDQDTLVIQAHTNPWKNKINGREDYLTGVISSHTDPARNDAHGLEIKYGYVEARIRLPREANGFRAAFWLYSDNAYNNAALGRRVTPPPVYEIDIMEYLPNSRSSSTCFNPQADLFGGALGNNETVLTYDTIFHTYHFPNDSAGRNRSPNNWTFNGSSAYTDNRCALGANFNMDFGSNDWITYGVLWEPDSIEWYVNDVMVHRVTENTGEGLTLCENNSSTFPIACVGPVHDGRMYILASLHMGFSLFEGSIDASGFTAEGGPELEIDHIRVMQRVGSSHEYCGVGGTACAPRQ